MSHFKCAALGWLTIVLILILGAFHPGFADTTVPAGVIDVDTQFTLAGAPYIVTGDVEVLIGATLTIEPGVLVRFQTGVELIVSGALVVQGTASQPVFLTADSDSPVPGYWTGVTLSGTGESNIDGCTIEYAVDGLTIIEDRPVIADSTIQFCTGNGVTVTANTHSPCSGSSAAPEIVRCTLAHNGGAGIRLDADADVGCTLFTPSSHIYGLISQCQIDGNGTSGVVVSSSEGYYAHASVTIIIRQNTITGNTLHGIQILGSENANPTIDLNDISNNGENGIHCTANDSSPDLRFNTITHNSTGIHNRNSDMLIENNLIAQNTGDGVNTDPVMGFAYNRLHDNSGYDFYYQGSAEQLAANNYWGTTDPSAIMAEVYDCSDDTDIGCVIIDPVNTVPDPVPPAVVVTSPADGDNNVSMATAISATFSEPIDPVSATNATVKLFNDGLEIPGAVSASGYHVSFIPDDPGAILPLTAYEVCLGTGIQDLFGNSLSTEYRWSFSTGILYGSVDITIDSARGMAFDGVHLWVSDTRTQKLFRVDPTTGAIVSSIDAPSSFPAGLAWDGTYLWCADPNTDTLHQIDTTSGSIVASIAAPSVNARGLAFDGNYLWNVDRDTETIYRIDPQTGTVVTRFRSPAPQPNGLAWDGTYLWVVADYHELFKLDVNGNVVSSYTPLNDASSYLGGLAFDGSALLASDYGMDRLYRLHCTSGTSPLGVMPAAITPSPGETVMLTISGGRAPYTVASSDDAIAAAAIANTLVEATGDIQGTAELTISDALGETFSVLCVTGGNIVVAEYDTPGDDASGLAFDGTFLWTADYSTDLIYKIDPCTGAIEDRISAPDNYTFGLTHDGTHLWASGYVTDTLYQIDPPTGDIVDSFASPGTWPWGLAFDGTHLWNYDADTETIYRLDPATGDVVFSFEPQVKGISDLTWDGMHLWAISRTSHQICRFTSTGMLVTAISIDAYYFPNGLTWDGTHLWLAERGTDKLYRLLAGAETPSPDFDYDGDVDGEDLGKFSKQFGSGGAGISIEAFAYAFGR